MLSIGCMTAATATKIGSTSSTLDGISILEKRPPPDSATVAAQRDECEIGKLQHSSHADKTDERVDNNVQRQKRSCHQIDEAMLLSSNNQQQQQSNFPLDGDWTQLPKVSLPPKEVFDPVQTFVANAIEEQDKENEGASPRKAYGALVDAFRFQKDPEMLGHIILALRTAANGNTLILVTKPKHARLMHNIVRLNPFTAAAKRKSPPRGGGGGGGAYALADAHLNLLMAIVSANSVFVIPIMLSLWKMITSCKDEPSWEMTWRTHAALATLMRLCPKGKTEMFPIIASNVPFRLGPEEIIVRYFQQTLLVVRYLPSIQNQIMELMIEKSLEIDVEIKINDDGEATIEKDDDHNNGVGGHGDIFEFDDDDDGRNRATPPKGKNNNNDETQSSSSPTAALHGVSDMANKLDSILYLLFQFVESRFTIAEIFPSLLQTLSNSVLTTHKSKFVQFVVLHACGLDEQRRRHVRRQRQELEQEQQHSNPTTTTTSNNTLNNGDDDDKVPFYRDFVSLLIQIVVDPYRATSIRQTAASYLASFVSRAAFVNTQTVSEAIAALLQWSETYMNGLDRSSIHAADARCQSSRHGLFYTTCQAAFYVMCFRGKEVMEYYNNSRSNHQQQEDEQQNRCGPHETRDVIDMSTERWSRICGHALRPLKYCLESVKTEFLQLATFYGWLDAGTLQQQQQQMASSSMEEEQRQQQISNSSSKSRRKKKPIAIRTPAALEKERRCGGVGGLGRGKNPLDSFFPFDPYLLRRSHIFIEPYYNHWSGSMSAIDDNSNDANDNNNVDEDIDIMEEDDDDDDVGSTTSTQHGGSDREGDDDDDDNGGAPDRSSGLRRKPSTLVGSLESMSESLSIGHSPAQRVVPSHEELQNAWAKAVTNSHTISTETGSW